jgi:4-alpha-glucanotransferase
VLRDQFELPGMRVMQFGLNGDRGARPHLPHCYPRHCVAYTTTHDFDTLAGWLQGTTDGRPSAQALSRSRRFALDYVNAEPADFHRAVVRALWMSRAELVVAPFQDLLGLGSEARMNRPGTPTGNWRWRAVERDLRPDLAEWLRHLSQLYDRGSEDTA